MTTPTGLRPLRGEKQYREACGCLVTDTRCLELCEGCLALWVKMHEEARAAVQRAKQEEAQS